MSAHDDSLFTPRPEATYTKQIEASLAPSETKGQRVVRDREQLETRLAAGDLDDIRTRVAYILNQYPMCRNSDIELSIRYWQAFEGDHLYSGGISFDGLRQVTPIPSIVRARATIQNTYGLFVADNAILGMRDELQGSVRQKQRAAAQAGTPFVHIYSDESGKTEKHYIVGSVWINDTELQTLKLQQRLDAWRKGIKWTSETHFVDITSHRKADYVEFFRQAMQSSEYIGFKATVLARDDVKKRPTEDAIFSLHYRLVVEGIRHEVASGRFELPRNLVVYKDQDEGSDKLHLLSLRDRLGVECPPLFDNQIVVMGVESIASSNNVLMMLADVFTGSVNRILNRPENGVRNHKDEVAEAVLSMLGADPAAPLTDASGDFVRVVKL